MGQGFFSSTFPSEDNIFGTFLAIVVDTIPSEKKCARIQRARWY